MTDNEKIALVNRFVEEFWNKGDVSAADRLMTKDVVIREPDVGGIAGLKGFNGVIRAAFPDWHSTPEEYVIQGDVVVERWTGHGTQEGEFMGVPASKAKVAVPGVVFYRLAGDKIAEFRGSFDQMSLMKQIGAIPA